MPLGFIIDHVQGGAQADAAYWNAVEIACRIVARTYRVEIEAEGGIVRLLRPYVVTDRGTFREEGK